MSEKWIKTDYELPIDDKEVLVCDMLGNINIAFYFDGEWQTKEKSFCADHFPYWIPLPKLPNEIDLKPCPFCGGKAELNQSYDGKFIVQCGSCGNGTLHHNLELTAINLWNTRI